MSDWRLSANSTIYREALKATESIHSPAVGFVKPQDITGRTTEVQFKQNNTIIQLLLKLTEQIEDLNVAVKRLEAVKGKEGTQPDDLTDSLDQIQQQLQKLSLGEPSKPAVPKSKGKLFVFKNPKEIFEVEKKKAA
ncbi:ORF II [Rhynchospora pubera]|uniref:ORF II n=1 Tax=Rhynchospora pubera TaxID=906938 RepID=A0AAV8ESL3_9POAL|nr:ORF II [Rhynchospora pubera]